ncbi:hypothetical protein QTP88_003787 [Uroleucon formosanum]
MQSKAKRQNPIVYTSENPFDKQNSIAVFCAQPIITRWGTWLEATSYYADNLNSIKLVLLSLEENTAKSIKNAIALFENRIIQNDLAYIKSNFGFITQSILKLENASLLLDKNLEIVENTKYKLGQNKGPIAEKNR